LATEIIVGNYKDWIPHLGKPEQYIEKALPALEGFFTDKNWEINFKPQKLKSDFEEMLKWFQQEMRHNPSNQHPGHHRLVWPKLTQLPIAEKIKRKSYQSEFYKNLQALLILRGLKHQTGLINSKWKSLIAEKSLRQLATHKGVIRLEQGRWPNGHRFFTDGWKNPTESVEIRLGNSTRSLRSISENALIARMVSNDFSPLVLSESWKLIPDYLLDLDPLPFPHSWRHIKRYVRKNIAKMFSLEEKKMMTIIGQKFGLPSETMKTFLVTLKQVKKNQKDDKHYYLGMLAPLWNWEDAPYLSTGKKSLIKEASLNFIELVAGHHQEINEEILNQLLSQWVKITNIEQDIEHYLKPQKYASTGGFEGEKDPLHFDAPLVKSWHTDVNNIPMGIEFTTRFPTKSSYKKNEEHLSLEQRGQSEWEIRDHVQQLAQSLREQFHVPANDLVTKGPQELAHGHGIDNFSTIVLDDQGRSWRVERDGINREYDSEGVVIPESVRGGHIELVTPKFIPQFSDLQKVFKSFELNSMYPNIIGGGHINVDLEPFKNNPKAMARFLSYFHAYRGIASLLFQHPSRLKSAEPALIDEEFHQQLISFEGTEEDLKKFLYNHHYFNTRLKRKSRYQQIDLSSYFQDVIPEEYITKDFDIISPNVLWRHQFRVSPHIRKMEFRMMDAPANIEQSVLMIKFVKALLHKALNQESFPTGSLQQVDYEYYCENPSLAFQQLKEMTTDLLLDDQEYAPYLAQRLVEIDEFTEKSHYVTFNDKIKNVPLIVDGWGEAVAAREYNQGPNYNERDWDQQKVSPHPQAIQFTLLNKNKRKVKDLGESCAVEKSQQALEPLEMSLLQDGQTFLINNLGSKRKRGP
jgi:hypothetical protein